MQSRAGSLLTLLAGMALLPSATLAADSSCTAHSSTEGTPRTCSITCDEGKQAVCEEGIAGSEPQCRCADKSLEAPDEDDDDDRDAESPREA